MRLRLADPSDGEGLRDIYGPVVATSAASFEYTEPTAADMAARVAATVPAHPWLVAVDGDDRVAGYAYAAAHNSRDAYDWSVNVSIYLRPDARGRGLGRALYTALFSLLDAQGFRQAFAGIALPNPASVALHRSLGFAEVGVYRDVGWKFDQWHDVAWWQRMTARSVEPPGPLRTVDALDATEIATALDLGSRLLTAGG